MRKIFRIRCNIPRNNPLYKRVYDFRPWSRYTRTAIPMMMIRKCSVDLIVARAIRLVRVKGIRRAVKAEGTGREGKEVEWTAKVSSMRASIIRIDK